MTTAKTTDEKKARPDAVRIICDRCGAVMEPPKPGEYVHWEYDRAQGWGRHDSEKSCIVSLGERLKKTEDDIRFLRKHLELGPYQR